MKRIIIVGGGASGYFVAANLNATPHCQVIILEKANKSLQKVKVSGGGRCNVTHACFDPSELVSFYPRGSKELRSVFSRFQPGDTMAWFEEKGVNLKIESDNRVFPVTDNSQSIMNALQFASRENGVEVRYNQNVKHISPQNNRFAVHTKEEIYHADYLVLCPGSSKPMWQLLRDMGHCIIDPVPSLFTFQIDNPGLHELKGTSFNNAEIKIQDERLESHGSLLITHWGLSGPAVLKLSAWGARELANLDYNFQLSVNWVGVSFDQVYDVIIDSRQNHPKQILANKPPFELTKRFWKFLLDENNFDDSLLMSQLSNKQARRIAEALTNTPFHVTGKSTFKDEFVTCGGVDLKEIDFKSMQSKLVPNLFLAGEVLNIDAITGGFNFQACWSEAFIIASNLNEELTK